jgi:hypothetical protein
MSIEEAENVCTQSSDCRGFITDGNTTTFKVDKWPEGMTVDPTHMVKVVAIKNMANVCKNNKCIACETDGDCEAIVDRPYCYKNTCVACTNTDDVRCADESQNCGSGVCYQYCAAGLPGSGSTYILKTLGRYVGVVGAGAIGAMMQLTTDKSKAAVITWACSGYKSDTGSLSLGTIPIGRSYYAGFCASDYANSWIVPKTYGSGFVPTTWQLVPTGTANTYNIISNPPSCPGETVAWYGIVGGIWNNNINASNPRYKIPPGDFEFIPYKP